MCVDELLYTKQLNEEPREGPAGRKPGGGGGGVGRGLPEHVAACNISASAMDSGQVDAQFINAPRYIRCQSLSICCLRKACVAVKHQSPSVFLFFFFQVGAQTRSLTRACFVPRNSGEWRSTF